MGLNFSRFAIISHGGPALEKSLPDSWHDYRLSSCPASGRFVSSLIFLMHIPATFF